MAKKLWVPHNTEWTMTVWIVGWNSQTIIGNEFFEELRCLSTVSIIISGILKPITYVVPFQKT